MKKAYYQKIYDINAWLGIHTAHLGYTRNLILALTVASLGFTLTKYENLNMDVSFSVKFFVVLAILLFVAAIIIGLFIAVKQSKIFRLYRTISRIIEKQKISETEDLDKTTFAIERIECDSLENINKYLFITQMIIYSLGIVCLTMSIF